MAQSLSSRGAALYGIRIELISIVFLIDAIEIEKTEHDKGKNPVCEMQILRGK
jgi:hypothetical protein